MALQIVGHGGACCGIRHIKNFTRQTRWNPNERKYVPAEEEFTAERIENLIASAVYPNPGAMERNGARTRGKIVEAVVTDSQFSKEPTLAQALYDAGFRIVNRFHNNTGQLCNVLHRTTGGRDLKAAARRYRHVRILLGE